MSRWLRIHDVVFCVINVASYLYGNKASRLNAAKASKSKALAALSSGLGECPRAPVAPCPRGPVAPGGTALCARDERSPFSYTYFYCRS